MDKPDKITLPVIFESFASRSDNSYKLVFSTNAELFGSEVGVLSELLRKHLYMLLKETEATTLDLKQFDELAEEHKEMFGSEAKTPAKRLRNVLYVLYEQEGSKGDFTEFYNKAIEGIINKVKEKLD